jgi:GNAT superfamily N-acetyltransferase
MTTYLSKNELSYDIDFGTNDDCLEVAQLFDEASEGLVKYYHDDIFNISGDLPIPSTGITEFAKFMSTSETQRVYNNQIDFDNYYMYKITNAVKATHRDKIVGAAICLPHNNVDVTLYMANHFNTEKKAHIQVYVDNKVADAWFIEQFIVKAPFTRQGMGTQILNKVKIYAYDNSYSKVSIFCYDKNTGSKTFLESQGFSVTKTIDVSSHPFFQSISVNNLHQMVCTI